MTTVQARDHFSDLINRVSYGKERIILKRRKRALAVVISIEDFELLEAIEDTTDLREAKKAKKESERKGTIRLEDLKKKLGL